MNAYLFIARKRKAWEKIELATVLRTAMRGEQKDVVKFLEGLAREAEIRLMFED